MTDRPFLTLEVFDQLTALGSRLSWIQDWLLNQVWSPERIAAATNVVDDYLLPCEREVKELEEVLAAATMRVYDELLTPPPPERDLLQFLTTQQPCAGVVFDGLSLRELPALLRLAAMSGFTVKEVGTSTAAVPSDTVDFTHQRLKLTGRVAPSALPGRTELRAAGIECLYVGSINERRTLNDSARAMLIWSAFPDQTYGDTDARFDQHFANIQTYLETAWMNTVQQVPKGRRIVVTSDHGYIFFGAGLSASRSNAVMRPIASRFGGERFVRLSDNDPPIDHQDVKMVAARKVAMLRGRVQVHTTGPDANKLYKHGGLSLMEMLTPWVVIER